MFGYIVANTNALSEEALQAYKSYYCGLCRCIGQDFGFLPRAALNYDITFLVVLLSSLYDSEEFKSRSRCAVRPFKTHSQTVTEATHYGAAMNIALAYHNCMDDWHDDKAFKALLLSKVFEKHKSAVAHQYPEKCHSIQNCLDMLSRLEQDNIMEPDFGANAFGSMLGELFAWKDDRWSDDLRQMGESLGRFIYLTDAVLDLKKDIKSGSYNPLRSRWSETFDAQDYIPILKILMGECTSAFERLPIIENTELLRNILYSGVWMHLSKSDPNSMKEEKHV